MLPLKAKGSIVWWPHQAKELTLPTILKVICVHFDLPGLAYPSNCSPSHQVNRKQTKFIPDEQFQQTSSLPIHWASAKVITRPTTYQLIRKNLVIHFGRSVWEKLEQDNLQSSGSVFTSLAEGQGRSWPQEAQKQLLLHGLIIFLLED